MDRVISILQKKVRLKKRKILLLIEEIEELSRMIEKEAGKNEKKDVDRIF